MVCKEKGREEEQKQTRRKEETKANSLEECLGGTNAAGRR